MKRDEFINADDNTIMSSVFSGSKFLTHVADDDDEEKKKHPKDSSGMRCFYFRIP